MSKIVRFLFTLMLLASCGNDWCSRAICGCWKSHTFHEEILVLDAESEPASGMSLFCETSETTFGVTNESGTVNLRIKGRSSPGCGVAAECSESTLRDPDGKIIAKINITQLLRGQEIAAGEYRLKVIRDGN